MFVPTDKKQHPSGKQVYLFGRVFVFVDQTLVYAYDPAEGDWMPVGVEDLVEMAQRKK